jgi:alpha,alpha-trehalose-phosphate synthase [UDP-forming]
MSRRLLIVSNRGPLEVDTSADGVRLARTVGGLASALDDTLRAHGGMWIAWVGTHAADELPTDVTGLPYPIRAVRLKERELNDYYAGFANQVMWPLCHTFPSRVRLQPTYWNAYRHANERFAAAVQAVVAPGDLVWVHDFHLCLVPGLLRAAGVPARIGVFWHVPFPPPSVFGILRWRTDVLAGMLGADLLAFQTQPDVENFLASVREFLDLPIVGDPPHIVVGGRRVNVVALPIGIDHAAFRAQARDPEVAARAARLRQTLGADVVMLGVDRLDYTKGILERLRGYERFLERHPEWRRRVCLVQVAVPSRDRVPDYREMKRMIDEAVGRIAGRFTADGRPPLAYVYTGLGRQALAAYYGAADIALVTPLRDGMNLVAKEFVAARRGDEGVLVLSEFAGAAQQLREAVLVNPYDPEAIRRALEVAIAMAPEERRRRMRALDRRVATGDIRWWTRTFIAQLATSDGTTATAA